jgi:hypothetical protein
MKKNLHLTFLCIGFGLSLNAQTLFVPGGTGGIGTSNNTNVGIGTADPGDYQLNVAGRIRANEIVINTTGADFVFEPTYKLRPLSEVETFIKANKRLPEIAPAANMQTNGVSMGEMQAKLLQKLEELTLYSIEQSKQLQEQRQSNAELKKRIEMLEQIIDQKLK